MRGKVGMEEKRTSDEKLESCLDLRILDTITAAMGKSLHLKDVLQTAAEKLIECFSGISGVEIYLLDEAKKVLSIKAHRGLPPELIGIGTLQKGEGLAGDIAKTEKPLFIETILTDKRVNPRFIKREKFSSYCGVPIFHEGTILGVLGLYIRNREEYSKMEPHLVSEVAHRIGMAVRNAQIYEQAAMRTRRFITVSRAITVTRQLGTLNEVLRDITRLLVQSLGFDQSWIGLVNENQGVLQGKVGFGTGMRSKGWDSSYSIVPESKNPAVMAVLQQKPVVYHFVEDVLEHNFKSWLRILKVQSFGFIPILSRDRAVGVIGVFYVGDQHFEEEDVKTLNSVAEQAAIAMENAQLYEQIKTSEERYRTLFESAGTSLVILDERQKFHLVNHAFESLSGYGQKELIGKMELHTFLKGSDRRNIAEKLKTPPQSLEVQFSGKDGVTKHVFITTTRIPDSSDVLVSVIDMTRQRELERRLFRSEELAAIGELSAGIAHEIRNPLVAITTSVALLKDEPKLSEEGRQLLDVVKEESGHLAAIVDDFLRYTKPKKPSFYKEDINKFLADVVKKQKERTDKKIEWIEEYDQTLKKIALDRHQIQQVITNLLLNSLDALPDEGVLKIQTKKEKVSGEERVRISITDSGIGIPEKEIQKIFQPFYSTKEKGIGMGLAICQRIVNDHNGEIFVKSEIGKGTTFFVVLPAVQKINQNHQ